jgi:hypothetical protein
MRRQLPGIFERVPNRFVEDVVSLGVPVCDLASDLAQERFGDDFCGRWRGSLTWRSTARGRERNVIA